MNEISQRLGSALLVLCGGCFLAHERGAEAEVAFDAGSGGSPDAGAPRVCRDSERLLEVVISGDALCTSGAHLFGEPTMTRRGEDIVLEGRFFGERERVEYACRVEIRNLGAATESIAARLARIADGFLWVEPGHVIVRDTTRCDGPAARECPLALEAESGRLRLGDGALRVAFGETRCTGECGGLRDLEFAYSLGPRLETASLAQGELSDSLRDVRFANLRSWNSCTDEGDIVTWAMWIQ
ncbi:MAG: hypothetical protein AAGE52_25060 [Myxococcota bacterium]